MQLVKDKPINGWGNGNFILARDTSPFMAEDAVFSSKTDNTYLQILIEKGILGFFAYFFLFVACAFIVFKGFKDKDNTKAQKLELALIFSGLMAFLIRELTFSSLFGDNTVYFLAFHLVFLLIPYDIGLKKVKISKMAKHSILLIGLAITIYLVYDRIEHTILNNHNDQFIKAYNEGRRSEAFDFLDRALKKELHSITLNKHKAVLLSKNALQIGISHELPNLLKFEAIEKDTLEYTKEYLIKIKKLNPFDDENLHNLGWIHFALGQKDSAGIYFDRALELQPYNSIYRTSRILFNLKNDNDQKVNSDLTRTIRYSPDILESIFYREFSRKYPQSASRALKDAIIGLKRKLVDQNNPILKARLARLLMEGNPNESYGLLREVTNSLPNLYRPWAYLGYLEEQRDTTMAGTYYEKAVFLSNGDFLPKLYYARFNKRLGNDKKGVKFYKEALQAYGALTSDGFYKNRAIADLRTIRNSYIPNDLLYYTTPTIPHQEIFKYFIDYYRSTGDLKTMDFYQALYKKYNFEIFRGNEHLK